MTVESWLGSVLFEVAASRDEMEQFSNVSRSFSTPLNTENMLDVSTFTEVVLLTGSSAAASVCCLARSVLITLMCFLGSVSLNHTDVLPKITDLRFGIFVLFCDLRQLLGQ